MIMVQKPFHLLSSPSTHHRRHPSAPPAVLVQPTHIPGLLSLSKPHSSTPPRSQQQQQQYHNHHNRQSRSSHNKTKSTSASRPSQQPPSAANVLPPLSEDLNKLSTPARSPTKSHTPTITPSTAPEKPPRGRQAKHGKDKPKPRSNSQSVVGKNNNRRNHSQLHQGSPPNPSNLPSQAEVTNKRNSLPQSHSLRTHQYNSFDPFLVSSESESDNPPATPTKANPPVHPAPQLSPRPTGKLARRRQINKDAPSTPTPSKAMSVPRRPEGFPLNLSRSVPSLSTIQSSEVTRDVFPICDDLTDAEDDDVFAPSTPIHPKGGSVTWLQPSIYDDGPRTAPLTNPYSSFPFHSKSTSSHIEGKNQHARSPSEGVFNLSMDEDNTFTSLFDASTELKTQTDFTPRRRLVSAATPPVGGKRDFWASSKFQNSPSPDVLPVPAFKGQAALN